METCSFEGCLNVRLPHGLCITHRRHLLRGEVLRPLNHRKTPRPPVCEFPGCGRKHAAYGLCAQHRKQQQRGDDLYEIGDRTRGNARKRQAWERLTPSERVERLRPMHQAQPYERSPEWGQRISAQLQAKWARGDYEGRDYGPPRTCPFCISTFQPTSPKHRFCSPQCVKDHRVASSHGITVQELRALYKAQGDTCAICLRKTKLHVDHDHDTGQIRGLLCPTCNTGLGKLGDNADNVRRALAYLER